MTRPWTLGQKRTLKLVIPGGHSKAWHCRFLDSPDIWTTSGIRNLLPHSAIQSSTSKTQTRRELTHFIQVTTRQEICFIARWKELLSAASSYGDDETILGMGFRPMIIACSSRSNITSRRYLSIDRRNIIAI